jgi:hypothetical protein
MLAVVVFVGFIMFIGTWQCFFSVAIYFLIRGGCYLDLAINIVPNSCSDVSDFQLEKALLVACCVKSWGGVSVGESYLNDRETVQLIPTNQCIFYIHEFCT